MSGTGAPPIVWTRSFGPIARFSLTEETSIEEVLSDIESAVLQSRHYDVDGIVPGYRYTLPDECAEMLVAKDQPTDYWDTPMLYLWPQIREVGYVFEGRWGSLGAPILDPLPVWLDARFLQEDTKEYIAREDLDAWRQAVHSEGEP